MTDTRYKERTIHQNRIHPAEMSRLLDSPMGDSVKILPAMLELSEEDKALIKRGSVQRTKVLQAFWDDLILGESSFQKESNFRSLDTGLIEKVFINQGRTIEHIRDIWKYRTREDITGTSGSDLVRLSCGRWFAIEDNLGNISGRASTYPVHKKFYEVIDLDQNLNNDFKRAIQCFMEEKSCSPIAILPPNKNEYLERERYLDVLSELKLPYVEVDDIDENFSPVGLINFNLKDFPGGKRGIAKLFKESNAPFFEAPYFKIICDKAFFPFMDELTRFYLEEEPLIPSLSSKRWQERKLPSDLKNKVLKMTSGHQGDGVYIFDEMSEREVAELQMDLQTQEELPEMLLQERVFPSVLKNLDFDKDEVFQLELRLVNYALGYHKIYCSDNITARIIPLSSGDSRCHISRGAFFTPVNN